MWVTANVTEVHFSIYVCMPQHSKTLCISRNQIWITELQKRQIVAWHLEGKHYFYVDFDSAGSLAVPRSAD